MKKVRWGVLSTANIGLQKVLPAMMQCSNAEIVAISSRNVETARAAAHKLGIEKAYDSYEALLDDDNIDAIYNPLPNHLHVPWTIKALQAGKHVLCEKPISLDVAEALNLLEISKKYPHLKLMEAFMYRLHPQWKFVKQKIADGSIGQVRTVHSSFSYYNVNPDNIRNQDGIGGGGLMDIGCYSISISRLLFDREPARVSSWVEFDPVMKTDRLVSGILDFETGTSLFTCSTQVAPFQRAYILGTKGSIEIDIPFNAPPDRPTSLWISTNEGKKEIVFEAVDQYTLQGEAFSQAILDDTPVPTPIEDAVNNMKVIEAIFKSAKNNDWAAV